MSVEKKDTFRKFITNSETKNELRKLFLWFNSNKGNTEIGDMFNEDWKSFKEDDSVHIDSSKIFLNIKQEIQLRKNQKIKNNLKKLLPYAAILIVILGIRFYLNSNNRTSEISNLHSLQTSVITEAGQRSKVILPDGSMVWLNSGTTLSYFENEQKTERRVNIEGEAFFQVSRDENKPFFVQCNDLIVKVLGTEFNVEAYPETDKISVVLESGSIQLSHERDAAFNYNLVPGEIANLKLSENKLSLGKVDIEKYTSWRNGVLLFENDPMKHVIEELERWYNIEVVVKDDEVYKSIFTGTITNEGYEQIFRLIEFSCNVNCDIINKTKSDIKPRVIMNRKK